MRRSLGVKCIAGDTGENILIWCGHAGRSNNNERAKKIGGVRVDGNREMVKSKKKRIEVIRLVTE